MSVRQSPKLDFKKMQIGFFIILIVSLGIACLKLLSPFFYPIFWAAIIAVMFNPVFKKVEKYVKIPSVSSFITVLLAIVILLLPLTTLGVLVFQESKVLYTKISENDFLGSLQDFTTKLDDTFLGPYMVDIQERWTAYIGNAAKTITTFIVSNIGNVTQNSLRFILQLFLTLYTLFYLLKDGKGILHKIMHLSPLGEGYEELLYDRFTSTTRATLKSTMIIGGIQGFIGGVLFWITGIEGALIWGFVMTILSIIPAVGSFIVWLPAGLIMLAMGNNWQGITILAVGVGVISLIDNLLRPPLIGKDTQMHPLLVLFSTLGGIALFGISGFIIGPVIIALFSSVLSMYDHYYKRELERN